MIRITAEASRTRLAISAGAVLADQLFWRWLKGSPALLFRHNLQVGEGLAAPFTWISPAGLLQIAEGLLTEAAVVPARPELQLLMEGVGKIADLKRSHDEHQRNDCMQSNCRMQSRMAAGQCCRAAATASGLVGGFSIDPTTLKPFSRRIASLRASSRSAATISATSCSSVVVGVQPSFS